MKTILLGNEMNKETGVTEIFGLSRSGKTTLLKKLIKKGKDGFFEWEKVSFIKKALYFLKFFFKDPIDTIKIYYYLNSNWIIDKKINFLDYIKIFKLRNSYVGAVLAKYEMFKNIKNEFYVDEFVTQSIFMIINRKSSKEKIIKIIKTLPKTGKIIIVESSEKERYERIKKTRLPAQQININYAKMWMENMEYNYKIIKEIFYGKFRYKEINIK